MAIEKERAYKIVTENSKQLTTSDVIDYSSKMVRNLGNYDCLQIHFDEMLLHQKLGCSHYLPNYNPLTKYFSVF